MTEMSNWRDVKARARAVDPTWDNDDRVNRRTTIRERMLATVSLDSLRAYVTGLGGQLNIVAEIGDIHLNVA